MENEIMNLRFNLTPKIQSLIIEMLVNKQMLEEGKQEADKVKLMQKHQEELKKEFIKNFGEDHWEEEEILAVLIKDCMHISVFLGVEALPICFENIQEDSRLVLEYPAHIEINRKYLHNHEECLKSICHELRHVYQIYKATDPENERHERWHKELFNHFTPINLNDKVSVVEYNTKEVEIDAYAFTQVIINQEYGLEIKHPNKAYQIIIEAYIDKYYN
jgi:hypothetical protein